jgi:hypothetical protein
MSTQSMEFNTTVINTIGTESLNDLYLQFLSCYEDQHIFSPPNPMMQEVRNKLYYGYQKQMKLKYDLSDIKIMDELARIDMEYRISKDRAARKYNKQPETNYDLKKMYDNSLAEIVGYIDEAGVNDPQLEFNYFNLLNSYDVDTEGPREFLESIYEKYFSKHLDDMSSIFEFYKLLKRKGMPDSEFNEVFGEQIYSKITTFITNHIENLTMPSMEDFQIKKRKN